MNSARVEEGGGLVDAEIEGLRIVRLVLGSCDSVPYPDLMPLGCPSLVYTFRCMSTLPWCMDLALPPDCTVVPLAKLINSEHECCFGRTSLRASTKTTVHSTQQRGLAVRSNFPAQEISRSDASRTTVEQIKMPGTTLL